jgi:3-dehydroquinate dehydratase/shikimate dehydrogenase
VLVLGAGGAARAAVFGCCDKGAEVFILNRTPETAQKLAKQSGAKAIKRDLVAKTQFDVIINATPVGMAGIVKAGAKSVPVSPLEAGEINARYVFDLVYNPIETPLLRMARQKGIPVITGVEMFVQQGARQFEIWTGKPAPEEEMLRVVLHSLRQSAEGSAETPAAAKAEAVAAVPKAEPAAVAAVPKEKPAVAAPVKAKTVTVAVKPKPVAKSAAPVRKAAPAKPVRRKPLVKAAVKVKPKAKSR